MQLHPLNHARKGALSGSRRDACLTTMTRLGLDSLRHVRPQPRTLPAAHAKPADEPVDISDLLQKYSSGAGPGAKPVTARAEGGTSGGSSSSSLARPLPPSSTTQPFTPSTLLVLSTGMAALLAANVGVYALAVWGGKAATVASMVLPAAGAKFWQYGSSAFVHASWAHLTRNLAIVWLTGTLARKELTSLGVWFTYIAGAVGANISAMYLMPAKVKAAGGLLGVGATGGAAALTITAMLLGLRLSPSYLAASLFFGQLVLAPLLALPVPGGPAAAQPLPHSLLTAAITGNGLPAILSHFKNTMRGAVADPGLTWLWGAALAAIVVVLIVRFPDPDTQGSK